MSVKSYSIGDTIIECKPFVHSLSDDKKKILCDFCFQLIIGESFNCEKCVKMFYCRVECKQLDVNHENECQIYSKYYYSYLKHCFYRLVLRLYLMIINDKSIESTHFQLYNGKKRRFNQLEMHLIEIKNNSKLIKEYNYLSETFSYFSNEFKFQLNKQQLYQLFCRLIINKFTILCFTKNCSKREPLGSGLYLKASILNHSCDPNSATVYYGRDLYLKAIKDIPIGDEITINYCDIELTKSERQQWLKNSFYFDCNCNKCQSNDSNIDFKHFQTLKQQMRSELRAKNPNWIKIRHIGNEWIDICTNIYGSLHPEFVLILVSILNIKLKNNSEDMQTLLQFINRVKDSVELIFGQNHAIFRYFRTICIQHNIKIFK